MFDVNGSSNGSNAPNGEGPGQSDRAGGVAVHWENLMSLRYWFGSLFGALAFVFGVSLLLSVLDVELSSVLVQLLFFGFLVLALIGGLVGRRYWCPHCRGSVKAGATVCRHCGREFTV